jgi:hypothetical protein
MDGNRGPGDSARIKRRAELMARAKDSNVNDKTLLATDYLNHVNEIVMLLELVPDMPESLEDCRAWQPMSYVAHFQASHIADKELAIEAYEFAPDQYRAAFDRLVTEMNRLIALSIERLDTTLAGKNESAIRDVATRASRNLQELIGKTSAVIHGNDHVIDQGEIDLLMQL